jgi:hypothetical protein
MSVSCTNSAARPEAGPTGAGTSPDPSVVTSGQLPTEPAAVQVARGPCSHSDFPWPATTYAQADPTNHVAVVRAATNGSYRTQLRVGERVDIELPTGGGTTWPDIRICGPLRTLPETHDATSRTVRYVATAAGLARFDANGSFECFAHSPPCLPPNPVIRVDIRVVR